MFFGWGTFVPVILVAAGVAPFFFTPTLYFLASLEFASSVVDEPSLKVMTLSGFPSFVTRAVALTVGVDVAPWPGFDPEVVGWGLLVEPAVEDGLLGVGFGAADVEPAFVEDGLAVEGFELDGFGCDVVGFVLLGLGELGFGVDVVGLVVLGFGDVIAAGTGTDGAAPLPKRNPTTPPGVAGSEATPRFE